MILINFFLRVVNIPRWQKLNRIYSLPRVEIKNMKKIVYKKYHNFHLAQIIYLMYLGEDRNK